MFKSIEYKLYLYLVLLVLSVALATYLFLAGHNLYGALSLTFIIFSLYKLYQHYNKFNKNILFLLNALDNGDYTFNFSTTKLSRREQELNNMMNRIKDILATARQGVIEDETFLSFVVESAPTGIIIIDDKNRLRESNKIAKELLGLPIFTHLNQLRVIDESFPELFCNLKEGEKQNYIEIVTERDKIQIALDVSAINIRDEELRVVTLNSIGSELEAQEMESWVKLIRVMTHEIMNSIAPITSLTDMLLMMYHSTSEPESEELKENTIESLTTINSTAKGLIEFVDSYREFSRVANPEIVTIEVVPFVEQVVKLQKADMEESAIEVEVLFSSDIDSIEGDRSQLTQVMVNLLKNAIEAFSDFEVEQKRVVIEVASDGDITNIVVSDNGRKISGEILEQIFIPFFTTKTLGSGIGLSVSRYIMRLHGGNLKYSANKEWTSFSMML